MSVVYTVGNEVGVESSPIVEVMSVLSRAVSKTSVKGQLLRVQRESALT